MQKTVGGRSDYLLKVMVLSKAELEIILDFLRAGEKERMLFDRKINCFDISFLCNE